MHFHILTINENRPQRGLKYVSKKHTQNFSNRRAGRNDSHRIIPKYKIQRSSFQLNKYGLKQLYVRTEPRQSNQSGRDVELKPIMRQVLA